MTHIICQVPVACKPAGSKNGFGRGMLGGTYGRVGFCSKCSQISFNVESVIDLERKSAWRNNNDIIKSAPMARREGGESRERAQVGCFIGVRATKYQSGGMVRRRMPATRAGCACVCVPLVLSGREAQTLSPGVPPLSPPMFHYPAWCSIWFQSGSFANHCVRNLSGARRGTIRAADASRAPECPSNLMGVAEREAQ